MNHDKYNILDTDCQPFAPIPRNIMHSFTDILPNLKRSSIAFFFYQLNQQYNYTDKKTGYSKPKNGDCCSYSRIAKCIGCDRDTAIKSANELVARNILLKTVGNGKFGNHYKINLNTKSWVSSSIHTTGSIDTTSRAGTTGSVGTTGRIGTTT
jgi:hypothetical protein